MLENSASHDYISQTRTDILIQKREEPEASTEGIILVNPLSWQLSSSSIPSSNDRTLPGVTSQPKAVIASAFPVSPDSNYSPGFRVPAGWSFSIGFHPIFSTSPTSFSFLTYSLRSQDGSELPAWMMYDSEYMTLSGVTPWDKSVPQMIFRLRMIGTLTSSLPDGSSERAITTAVAQSFTFILAQHTLEYLSSSSAQPGYVVLNLTTGGERVEQPFIFGIDAGDITGILLDGKQITESDIKDLLIDPSAVEWADLHSPTNISPRLLTLSTGAAGSSADAEKSELPIILTDNYGETLQVILKLKYKESVFRYSAGMPGWWFSTNLLIGQDFDIPLNQNLTREITQRTIQQQQPPQPQQQNALGVKPLPSWMSLQLDPLTVSGTVPANVANQTLVSLAFQYRDPETFAVSTVKWNITLLLPPSPDDEPGTRDTTGADNASGSAAKGGLSRGKIIAIAGLSSILGLAILFAIAWFARKIFIARMLEKTKWASILHPLPGGYEQTNDRKAAGHAVCDSPPSFTSNLKGQKALSYQHVEEPSSRPPAPPQLAYHRAPSYHKRPSAPVNMVKSFIGTAMMTPTKKARKMVADMKDRSLKRYTRSFMSYPIDYPIPSHNTPDVHANQSGGEEDTSATELVPITASAAGPTSTPPSPTPHRPTSVTASLAPFPFIDPPLSGLPSTAFTSDSFLHGHHPQTASPASWEESANAAQVSHMRYLSHNNNVQYYAGSADAIQARLTIANPESNNPRTEHGVCNDHGEQQQQSRPPPASSNRFLLAEICHQQSTILRSQDPTTGFSYSITSAGDSIVNVEERYM
ncbi:hypothetical protein QFC24_004986 [Naganishia onofrii]|uniref:Uncharacterized protein n=1 Tax=Naganishia onofrii TaxID=1851511 RepID=A0ACC2XC95_9TREE|nr:hypothetical protein QFC24_004986 [Naganishia onofrii]